MLFRVRSSSLDSITTALSFGTESEPQPLSRASSLDSLLPTPKHTRVINIHGKQYMLLDNESIVSTITSNSSQWVDVRDNPPVLEGEIPSSRVEKKNVSRTQSEPIRSRCCVEKEPACDQFSDNFVMGEVPMMSLTHTKGSQVRELYSGTALSSSF